MATDQTDGVPPKRGSANFVNIGCTINKSAALRTTVAVNVASSNVRRREAREIGSLAARQAVSISQAYPVALVSEIVLVVIRPPMALPQEGSPPDVLKARHWHGAPLQQPIGRSRAMLDAQGGGVYSARP